MSPILLLSIVLQIGCAVHVIRTGRPMYWVFLLLIGSYIAVVIYLLAEVLPDMRNNPGARRAMRDAHNRIDPARQKRQAAAQLDLADTADNRRRLAEESLRTGDFAHAEELYGSALQGMYRTDPHLMLGMAQAQFGQGHAQRARDTLDALIAANPEFRSSEGHLLYARSLEAMGDVPAALHEYEALVQGYPGEEARARYGLLLRHDGQTDKAHAVFAEILKRSNTSPAYYRRDQREWIDLAQRESRA
ncbi:MAG: tetratricopeptide repeat protein [Thermomonas sp.]